MKTILTVVAGLLFAITINAQSPTPWDAYKLTKKVFIANDTATLAKMCTGWWAEKVVRKMRLHARDTAWTNRNHRQAIILFNSMQVLDSIAEGPYHAYFTSCVDQGSETYRWLVFMQKNGPWYFAMLEDGYYVGDAYRTLVNKISMVERKYEKDDDGEGEAVPTETITVE